MAGRLSVGTMQNDVNAELHRLLRRDKRGLAWCAAMIARSTLGVFVFPPPEPLKFACKMALRWGGGHDESERKLQMIVSDVATCHMTAIRARLWPGDGASRDALRDVQHADAVSHATGAVHRAIMLAWRLEGGNESARRQILDGMIDTCTSAVEAIAHEAAAAPGASHPAECGPEYRRATWLAWRSIRLFLLRQKPMMFDLRTEGRRPRSDELLWVTRRIVDGTRGWPAVAWDRLEVYNRPDRRGELGEALARWYKLGFDADEWIAMPLARAVVERCTVEELQPIVWGDR